jgi:hypothetical protein
MPLEIEEEANVSSPPPTHRLLEVIILGQDQHVAVAIFDGKLGRPIPRLVHISHQTYFSLDAVVQTLDISNINVKGQRTAPPAPFWLSAGRNKYIFSKNSA